MNYSDTLPPATATVSVRSVCPLEGAPPAPLVPAQGRRGVALRPLWRGPHAPRGAGQNTTVGTVHPAQFTVSIAYEP